MIFLTETCWLSVETELVEYTKKLFMTGILMKAAQGSASQVFLGLLISFIYFAIVVRCMPYRSMLTNIIRVSSELQLFITMLCMLMLRIDLHEEWVTNTVVTWILITVNFIMTPIPLVLEIFTCATKLLGDLKDLDKTGTTTGGRVAGLKLLCGSERDFEKAMSARDQGEHEHVDVDTTANNHCTRDVACTASVPPTEITGNPLDWLTDEVDC